MSSYNPAMQKRHLADIAVDEKGLVAKRTADLDGVRVSQITFSRGARWSVDLKESRGTEFCELPHVGLVMAGALGVRMVDGSEDVFVAGDVMMLPPGHDVWAVGEDACTFVEFSRGNDYYAT